MSPGRKHQGRGLGGELDLMMVDSASLPLVLSTVTLTLIQSDMLTSELCVVASVSSLTSLTDRRLVGELLASFLPLGSGCSHVFLL